MATGQEISASWFDSYSESPIVSLWKLALPSPSINQFLERAVHMASPMQADLSIDTLCVASSVTSLCFLFVVFNALVKGVQGKQCTLFPAWAQVQA